MIKIKESIRARLPTTDHSIQTYRVELLAIVERLSVFQPLSSTQLEKGPPWPLLHTLNSSPVPQVPSWVMSVLPTRCSTEHHRSRFGEDFCSNHAIFQLQLDCVLFLIKMIICRWILKGLGFSLLCFEQTTPVYRCSEMLIMKSKPVHSDGSLYGYSWHMSWVLFVLYS